MNNKKIEFKKKFGTFIFRTGLESLDSDEVWSWIEQALEEEREKVKHNIGQLRQWLNERPFRSLLTNKDLEIWLLSDQKKKINRRRG